MGQKIVPVKRTSNQFENDDDCENRDNKVAIANDWAKLKDNCKKAKSNAHDNYDASKFVSPFRKPLTNVLTNTVDSKTKEDLNSSTLSSHVTNNFYFIY